MNGYFSGTGLSSFACSAEECLSWIIILLNILTVFYLVFCAWFKVTKAVKVVGYVWASAHTVGTVAVVAIHTCIFTILSAIFSALIIMAVLSVVFDKGIFANSESGEKHRKPSGAYVIHKTDNNNYVFALYDNAKKMIARSFYNYPTIDEVKADIEKSRRNGSLAAMEDRTKNWIEYVNHPKFELFGRDGKYSFLFSLSSNETILRSDDFNNYEPCEKTLKAAMNAILSEKVYFAENSILPDKLFEPLPTKETSVMEVAAAEDLPDVFDNTEKTEKVERVEIELNTDNIENVEKTDAVENAENSGVKFNTARKTLWELYAELSATQRAYFDKIRARAEEKEKVKSSESKDAYTVAIGRDKIVKLRIRKNIVESVFFVTDIAFKKLSSESEAKVKETPTVIRITDDDYLKLALDTVDYKYDAVIAARKKRSNKSPIPTQNA